MADLPKIGPAAASYIEAFETHSMMSVQALKDPDPEQQKIALGAMGKAAGMMQVLAFRSQAVADQLKEVVDYTPTADPRTEGMRQAYLEILDNPTHEVGGQRFSENELRSLLNSLPSGEDYPVQTRDLAGYLLHCFELYEARTILQPPMPDEPTTEQLAREVVITNEETPTAAPPELEAPDEPPYEADDEGEKVIFPAEGDEDPITPEVDDGKLVITVGSDMVLQFPDGSFVSLWRTQEASVHTLQEERAIAENRARALFEISQIPEGKRQPTSWVFEKVMPGMKFDGAKMSGPWTNLYGDFLRNLTAPNGKKLVERYKATETSKRAYWLVGEQPYRIVFSELPSGFEDPNHFELPPDNILFGRQARLMNHLANHLSEDNPIDVPNCIEKGVLTEEEVSQYDVPSSALSNIISGLTRTLRNMGLEDRYIVKKGLHKERLTPGNRREPVYWLEYGLSKELKARVTHVVNLLVEHEDKLGDLGLSEELVGQEALIEMAEVYGNNHTYKLETQLKSLDNLTQRETIEELLKCVAPDNSTLNKVIEIVSRFANFPELKEQLEAKIRAGSEAVDKKAAASDKKEGEQPAGQAQPESENRLEQSEFYAPVREVAERVLGAALPTMHNKGMLALKRISTEELGKLFGLTKRQRPRQNSIVPNLALLTLLRNDRAYSGILRKVSKPKGGEINEVATLVVQQIYTEYLEQNEITVANGNSHS